MFVGMNAGRTRQQNSALSMGYRRSKMRQVELLLQKCSKKSTQDASACSRSGNPKEGHQPGDRGVRDTLPSKMHGSTRSSSVMGHLRSCALSKKASSSGGISILGIGWFSRSLMGTNLCFTLKRNRRAVSGATLAIADRTDRNDVQLVVQHPHWKPKMPVSSLQVTTHPSAHCSDEQTSRVHERINAKVPAPIDDKVP